MQNDGMRRMVVCAGWYLWNGMGGMAGMGLVKWKPEGWECLVYRIVYTPHPCEEFFGGYGEFTRLWSYVYCLFSSPGKIDVSSDRL